MSQEIGIDKLTYLNEKEQQVIRKAVSGVVHHVRLLPAAAFRMTK